MKATTVNVHEAKTGLSRLLARVAKGEEIVIAKAGRPLARLVPFARPQKMHDVLDLYKGEPEDVIESVEGGRAHPP